MQTQQVETRLEGWSLVESRKSRPVAQILADILFCIYYIVYITLYILYCLYYCILYM